MSNTISFELNDINSAQSYTSIFTSYTGDNITGFIPKVYITDMAFANFFGTSDPTTKSSPIKYDRIVDTSSSSSIAGERVIFTYCDSTTPTLLTKTLVYDITNTDGTNITVTLKNSGLDASTGDVEGFFEHLTQITKDKLIAKINTPTEKKAFFKAFLNDNLPSLNTDIKTYLYGNVPAVNTFNDTNYDTLINNNALTLGSYAGYEPNNSIFTNDEESIKNLARYFSANTSVSDLKIVMLGKLVHTTTNMFNSSTRDITYRFLS